MLIRVYIDTLVQLVGGVMVVGLMYLNQCVKAGELSIEGWF